MKAIRYTGLLLALLLLLAACAAPAPTRPAISFTGQGLAGAVFGQREVEGVTVHYTLPTTPDVAESAATQASSYAREQLKLGHMRPGSRVELWVVPAGAAWPTDIPTPPPFRQFRAVSPGVVIGREEGVKSPDEGLRAAVAVAASQPGGSAAFQVDWLHEGIGTIMAGALDTFPTEWQAAGKLSKGPKESYELLRHKPAAADKAAWQGAARALATSVMDRWGVNWSTHAPRTAAEMTPTAALLWSTGASDEESALRLWGERQAMFVHAPSSGVVFSIADQSPVRLEPKLPAPPKGPGPMDNYSPHSYDIDVRYEPATREVTGTERLTWRNGESIPVDTLYFNLWPNAEQYAQHGGAIAVQSVKVGGQPVKFTAHYLDLVVPLGRAVAPGEQVVVEIGFTSRLPAKVTSRVFGQNDDALFNLAHWFPILAVLDERGWVLHPLPDYPGEPYSENAGFTVKLDVPSGTTVAATGHPTGRTEMGDRWVYQWEAPNVKDWVAVGGKSLVEEDVVVEGVTIRGIDPSAQVAREVAVETGRALKLFHDRFGPYAYQDLVVVPCCAGLEYPGLFYTAGPSAQSDDWRGVVYHELGHQWFYGMVGNDQYNEAWLDEGFARYAERLGLKSFGYARGLRDLRVRPLAPELHVNSSTVGYTIYGGYVVGVYDRGALVLEDLEQLLGPAGFRQVMRTYVERFRFKTATTADFVRTAEDVSGRDLKQFFAEHRIDPSVREGYRPVMPPGVVKPR